ncbi:MAG: polyprenyl diphosphate synthase [bacterium]|nr:polyprenyl diphosphate synthase [bacterium]
MSTITKAKHVAIILDGNRRWARSRDLPTLEGHLAGRHVTRECLEWSLEAGLSSLTIFAFSTENWKRNGSEVAALMALFVEALKSDLDLYIERGVRLKVVGERDRLNEELRALVEYSEEKTKDGATLTLYIALSYGGRSDILHAITQLEMKGAHAISPDELLEHLMVPVEPDLIIRTGGERRLSNFLLWQAAYSELFFVDTLWPDFTKEEFLEILESFNVRSRRFGA